MDESVVHAAFIPFGEIKEVQVPMDNSSRESRTEHSTNFDSNSLRMNRKKPWVRICGV